VPFALALTMLCALTVAQTPTAPGPSPPPSPGASAMPSASPSAATPSAIPSALPPPPSPVPTPAYRFVYRPPAPATPGPAPDDPAIFEIDLSDAVIVSPSELDVRVLTSPAVVSVTARALGRSIALPPAGPGVFGFSATIRDVPDTLRNRRFEVEFVAAAQNGRTASITLPLVLK
jgi:hypothetical protein